MKPCDEERGTHGPAGTTIGRNETVESKVAVSDEERGRKGVDTSDENEGRTEGPRQRGTEESISLGNSNLHLFYYIIIPTRRSISGALKRRFSNRFAWNTRCSLRSRKSVASEKKKNKRRIEG